MILQTDSEDYHLLTEGVRASQYCEGNTLEIGLRRGGGTGYIIDALAQYSPKKTHIAIDPYGHIPYEHKEGEVVQLDYTNEMYRQSIWQIYKYAADKGIDFIHQKMEDTEFFKRFADGFPIYDVEKTMANQYSFIHYDGPHAVEPLIAEMKFFKDRTTPGGTWCFDDILGYYDHNKIEEIILTYGFVLLEKTNRKALYQKK